MEISISAKRLMYIRVLNSIIEDTCNYICVGLLFELKKYISIKGLDLDSSKMKVFTEFFSLEKKYRDSNNFTCVWFEGTEYDNKQKRINLLKDCIDICDKEIKNLK